MGSCGLFVVLSLTGPLSRVSPRWYSCDTSKVLGLSYPPDGNECHLTCPARRPYVESMMCWGYAHDELSERERDAFACIERHQAFALAPVWCDPRADADRAVLPIVYSASLQSVCSEWCSRRNPPGSESSSVGACRSESCVGVSRAPPYHVQHLRGERRRRHGRKERPASRGGHHRRV